jgi:hypothetical protein
MIILATEQNSKPIEINTTTIELLDFNIANYDKFNLYTQRKKIYKEHLEVMITMDYKDLAGELLDLMQACKTCLDILQKQTGDMNFVKNANERHINKLISRHKNGDIRLDDGNNKFYCKYNETINKPIPENTYIDAYLNKFPKAKPYEFNYLHNCVKNVFGQDAGVDEFCKDKNFRCDECWNSEIKELNHE